MSITKKYAFFLLLLHSWFFENVLRKEADKLLLAEENPRGTFLVRPSEHNPNGYSLSVKDWEDGRGYHVKHYRIKPLDNGGFYIATNQTFPSLQALVMAYSSMLQSSIMIKELKLVLILLCLCLFQKTPLACVIFCRARVPNHSHRCGIWAQSCEISTRYQGLKFSWCVNWVAVTLVKCSTASGATASMWQLKRCVRAPCPRPHFYRRRPS